MKQINKILLLSVLFFTTHAGIAQSLLEQRLVKAVSNDDLAETSRLLDSSGFNFRRTCFNDLSLFEYSMFADSLRVFTWLLEKTDSLTSTDLGIAAGTGNRSQPFLLALQRFYSTNLEDYYPASLGLLAPLTDSVRWALRKLLSKKGFSEEEFEKLDGLPFARCDTPAVKTLIAHVERLSSKAAADSFFTKVALDGEIIEPSSGSSFLMRKYVYSHTGRLTPAYQPEHFTSAFENGRWSLVDLFFQRGESTPLQDVNTSKVTDPHRAIGYFVRYQLLDQPADLKALQANRAWKGPAARVIIPANNFVPGKERVSPSFTPEYVKDFEYTLRVEGATLDMTASSGGRPIANSCNLALFINHKKYSRIFAGKCKIDYIVTIPASDTVIGGEYHSVVVWNPTSFRQVADAPGKNYIRVYRDSLLIDSIAVGSEATLNRAFGPLELRATFEQNLRSFGMVLEFMHVSHAATNAPTGPKSRLSYYKQLFIKIQEARDTASSAKSYDARTGKLLLSEQLIESSIVAAIKGELQIAIQTLAEESGFNAGFYNLIYGEIAGADIMNALETFLLSPDPAIRQQAQVLRDALDRRTAAWSMLEDVNTRNYVNKVHRVKNLIYELGQFYKKDNLMGQLNAILSQLPNALKDQFFKNVQGSTQIFNVREDDLNGKASVVKQFLKL